MKQPQLLPVSMRRFGVNLYGEPLYRVVFSDSRTALIGGKWPDGACEYRETPLYPGLHSWILEKWLSAQEFAGSREDYAKVQLDPASGLLTLGPYPERGEYQHCYTFPVEPTESTIAPMIWAITKSRALTPGQRKESIMDPLLRKKKRAEDRIDAIFDDSQGAFRHATAMMAARSVKNIHARPDRRAKDVDFKYGAEDLGLPVGENQFFQGKR